MGLGGQYTKNAEQLHFGNKSELARFSHEP